MNYAFWIYGITELFYKINRLIVHYFSLCRTMQEKRDAAGPVADFGERKKSRELLNIYIFRIVITYY